ncbi:serine O-acetyltransferase [uncultured Umboniibacter sp.]|uniref:serine O-acetyltransferase n=1 Tax=uncultured Umboniibacter sp. TaxID=1798917 RepID=UPI0026348F91|nr:serine O-acetyltransferase [uncultured Umboniibacter sp.]
MKAEVATANVIDSVWAEIQFSANAWASEEPSLASYLHATILKHNSLLSALSYHIASKLDCTALPALAIRELAEEALADQVDCIRLDLAAVHGRDPACDSKATAFLYFKGFLALQSYRVAHYLWVNNRHPMALFFQSQISHRLGVDIHPAAEIGMGVMFDHATGIVIGETAVIEDMVSILHSVTLGGTGKESDDRHPKIRYGVLVGAGAKVLGNIEVGACAQIAAGSVVLQDVEPRTVVAGVPATVRGESTCIEPAQTMDHSFYSA